MPRKLLNKLLPDRQRLHDKLHGKWYVRPFDFILHDPALWHVGRRGTSRALALGVFIACLPIPGHVLMAVLGALYWRINLPIAFAAVWINNPLTIGPIYYMAYRLGRWILHILHSGQDMRGYISKPWLAPELSRAWHILEPVLLGGVIEGLLLALIAYFALDLAWRLSIVGRWKLRQRERRARRDH